MAKAKPKAVVMVADGAGGMMRVQDRRFEAGEWPIRFEISNEPADTWLRYFQAECERRGWSSGAIGQLEAKANSGSITVNTGGVEKPQLVVVWERKPGGPIKVRARSAGAPEFPLPEARELFERVNERCLSGVTEHLYRRGLLEYEGLAWRGELWLDDMLRLGPPSRQDETAMLGPRIILVDALVDCVGNQDAIWVFDLALRELSAFLSVAMGTAVQLPKPGRAWTFKEGAADCAVRNLGYLEPEGSQQMPARGACRSIPLRPVNRPDFSMRGIDGTINEVLPPADVIELWTMYRALTAEQRRQFLQAAAKWQEALANWGERSTLSFALMVVACEALKPSGLQFRDHNIYHVVEALLGKATAEQLREEWFRPQDVRGAHLHLGEFRGSEFHLSAIMSSYRDPTFDQACRELAKITPAAIIEWLRCGGAFTMPPLKRRKTLRRWVKDHTLTLLPVLLAVGLALGWYLRIIWPG